MVFRVFFAWMLAFALPPAMAEVREFVDLTDSRAGQNSDLALYRRDGLPVAAALYSHSPQPSILNLGGMPFVLPNPNPVQTVCLMETAGAHDKKSVAQLVLAPFENLHTKLCAAAEELIVERTFAGVPGLFPASVMTERYARVQGDWRLRELKIQDSAGKRIRQLVFEPHVKITLQEWGEPVSTPLETLELTKELEQVDGIKARIYPSTKRIPGKTIYSGSPLIVPTFNLYIWLFHQQDLVTGIPKTPVFNLNNMSEYIASCARFLTPPRSGQRWH
jgi:hypothetical protein